MRRLTLSSFAYNLALIIVAMVLAVPFGRTAAAQDRGAEIRSLLQSRDAEIKRLLGRDDSEVSPERKERLRTVINDVIDFEAMSRGALGPHWDGLTGAQRTEFVDVFGAIVRGQSLSNLDPYRASVTYESIDASGNEAHVVTKTIYKEVPITIAYDLHWNGADWRATDIIIDDVSTVEGYARSFQTMVRKRGFDSLMERLRAKRAEVEAEG